MPHTVADLEKSVMRHYSVKPQNRIGNKVLIVTFDPISLQQVATGVLNGCVANGITAELFLLGDGPAENLVQEYKNLLTIFSTFRPDILLAVRKSPAFRYGIFKELNLPTIIWCTDEPVFNLDGLDILETHFFCVPNLIWKDQLIRLGSPKANVFFLPLGFDDDQVRLRTNFSYRHLIGFLGGIKAYEKEFKTQIDRFFSKIGPKSIYDAIITTNYFAEGSFAQIISRYISGISDFGLFLHRNASARTLLWRLLVEWSAKRRLDILESVRNSGLVFKGGAALRGSHFENYSGSELYKNAQMIKVKEDVLTFFQSCLLNLNISNIQMNQTVSPREWDILGAGCSLVTEKKSVFPPELVEGLHYIGYSSQEEFLEKINYYSDRPDISIEMARRAQPLVLKKHTYTCRIKKLLTVLNQTKINPL